MNFLPLCDEQQYIFNVNEAIKSIPMKITYSMEFSKSFSAEELSFAVDQCIKMADVFAARCIVKDDIQCLEFVPYQKQNFPVYDFSTQDEFQRFCDRVRSENINNREKLYSIFIYSIAGSYYHIFFSFNHLIFDGVSGLLLSEKIQKALNEDNKEQMIWHPYYAHLNNVKKYKESQKYLEDSIFWEDRFLELSKCNALFSGMITTEASTIQESSFRTTQNLKEELLEFCNKNNIKLYCLIVAILAQLLSEKTNCRCFCFEIPIANRAGANDKNSIGLYEVTFPFIFDFDRDQTLSDLLRSIEKQSIDYYRHNNFDWNTKIVSEQNEKKYGKYIPQISLSYFCTNKEQSHSFVTLNYHHCEMELLPMTVYISDYLDWRTITFHYMYWDHYFTEQEVMGIHQKLERQMETLIDENGGNDHV